MSVSSGCIATKVALLKKAGQAAKKNHPTRIEQKARCPQAGCLRKTYIEHILIFTYDLAGRSKL